MGAAVKESAALAGERARTVASVSQTTTTGSFLTMDLRNDGNTSVSDYTSMDFIVDYQSASGPVHQRLSYTTSSVFGLAIELDAISTASSGGATTTLTFQHTVGDEANLVLIVGAEAERNTFGSCDVATTTFNGTLLTKAIATSSSQGSGVACASLWYLNSPVIGQHDIVVEWESVVDARIAGSISVYNAAQTGPEATSGSAASATSITTNVTTITDASWVVDAVSNSIPNSLTEDAGQTERYQIQEGDSIGAGSTKELSVAGLTSMGWSKGGAEALLAHVVAAFAPEEPPRPGFWTNSGLNQDAKNPGHWDHGETLVLDASLSPAPSASTSGAFSVALPNGVTVKGSFSVP